MYYLNLQPMAFSRIPNITYEVTCRFWFPELQECVSTLEQTGTNIANSDNTLSMNAYLHCHFYHKFQN